MNTPISWSRSYDLRGIYDKEITPELLKNLGRCFAHHIEGKTVAIGYDARHGSPELAAACAEGIRMQWKDVVMLGMVSTDMVSFATYHYDDIDAGIMITASHNPREYNGAKLCSKYAAPVNLKTVGPLWETWMKEGTLTNTVKRGTITERTITHEWIEYLASRLKHWVEKMHIIVDAGNGVAGVFMRDLCKKIGVRCTELFFEPDGNFPNHRPSPIESENTQVLVETVRSVGADIGIAFDGDADRAVFCDKNGVILSGSVVTALIAESLLVREEHRGKKVLYNAVCHSVVDDTIQRCGGVSICEKVGHIYIKERMRADKDIIFAGEHSAHYYFADNYCSDSGALAFIELCNILWSSDKNLSEIRQQYEKTATIEETNFSVIDILQSSDAVIKAFPEATQQRFDGITLRFANGWINIRPSSNEPLLRINMEASDTSTLQTYLQRVQSALHSHLK